MTVKKLLSQPRSLDTEGADEQKQCDKYTESHIQRDGDYLARGLEKPRSGHI